MIPQESLFGYGKGLDREIDPGSGQAAGLILAVPGDNRPFAEYGSRQPVPCYSSSGVVPGLFGNRRLTVFPGSEGMRIPRSLPNLNAFSVAQWFSQSNTAGTYFSLSNRLSDTANGIVILYEQLWGVEVAFLNGGALTRVKVGSPLSANTLYHVCGTHQKDSSTIILYLNGVSVGGMTETGATSPGNAGEFYLGLDGIAPTPYYFSGGVFDTRFYNRALSAAEVMNIYRNPDALYMSSGDPFYDDVAFRPWFVQPSIMCQ